MKTFTRNVLIQLFIGGALFAFALWIHQGLTLLAVYGVMLAVIVLGWALRQLIMRVESHLRRVYEQRRVARPPRHHEDFDDAV